MYQAKKAGRGRFTYFSDDMSRLAQERLTLENALRQALQEADDSLRLHYQPQIETSTGHLYGVEALARWHHSELKLDRCFVADLETDAAAQSLSSAILGIGKSLSLTVVAEGVETVEQNETLRQQGYPVVQGYLFSKPLAPAEFERWMRETGRHKHP